MEPTGSRWSGAGLNSRVTDRMMAGTLLAFQVTVVTVCLARFHALCAEWGLVR